MQSSHSQVSPIPLIHSIDELPEGKIRMMRIAGCGVLPVLWSRSGRIGDYEAIVVDHPERLAVLHAVTEYPHLRALLRDGCLDYAQMRKEEVLPWLGEGIYVFGAYKIGTKVARMARAAGVKVLGFLDNDLTLDGSTVEGCIVRHPSAVALRGAVVVVASGQHSNAINAQLKSFADIRIINLHEFLYALNAKHGPENFSAIVEAPVRDRLNFLSAFLRLDDEHSRRVFDALIEMRVRLATLPAESVRSPSVDEYFDPEMVTAEQSSYFVDAGAASGDTLRRLELHFGLVRQAWLFEPELSAYYEALKGNSDRPNIWLFNMGLDENSSRAIYQSELSYDVAGELSGELPSNITSYIQGVPLDAVVHGKVGLFKLDIEGMEASALRGARSIIKRDKPTLAVCAYHRPDDFWRLMDEVLTIRPDYRVGIRLYADILEDITLYFY